MLQRLLQAILLATAVSLPVAIFNGTLFSWHPVLMSVGYLALMGQGVLAALQFRQLEGLARVKAIQTHALWQAAALLCIGGGFAAIYENKVRLGKSHFITYHGKSGLLTFLLSLGAATGGVASFRKLGLLQKLPENLQPLVKLAHRNAGFFTWLLSLFTIELALIHPSVWKGLFSRFWQLAVLGAGVVGVVLRFSSAPGPMPTALASDEHVDAEEASIMLTERGEGEDTHKQHTSISSPGRSG